MQHETIHYFDGDQKLIGELIFDAHSNAKRPGIIVFPAFEGRSEFAVNYAENLAKQGYVALAADMYGNAETTNTIDGCFKLVSPFFEDRALTRRRALLAFQALSQHPLVDNHKIGAMGFCFGGMCVLEIARSGENLIAGVTAHGVLTKADLPNNTIKSKLLILHGYQDPLAPHESVDQFAKEMAEANVNDWTAVFFGTAKHSYTDPLTGTFDPAKEKTMGREYHKIAAERTFRYAVDFFAEQLQQ